MNEFEHKPGDALTIARRALTVEALVNGKSRTGMCVACIDLPRYTVADAGRDHLVTVVLVNDGVSFPATDESAIHRERKRPSDNEAAEQR